VEVLVVDDHVAVLPDLVAALDLAVGHLVVTLRAPALVRDGGVVVGTELAEGALGGGLRGVVQADRDRDHSEGDHAFPHRSRHGDAVYLLSQWLATFRRLAGAVLSGQRLRADVPPLHSKYRASEARAGE